MSFKTVKLKWAKKLLKAKMFVVMTEKESAIAIDGADPYSFTDALALAAQSAELEMFHESLGNLIKEHQQALKVLGGETDEKDAEPTEEEITAAAKATALAKAKVDAKQSAKAKKQSGRVRATTGGTKTPSSVSLKKAKTTKK